MPGMMMRTASLPVTSSVRSITLTGAMAAILIMSRAVRKTSRVFPMKPFSFLPVMSLPSAFAACSTIRREMPSRMTSSTCCSITSTMLRMKSRLVMCSSAVISCSMSIWYESSMPSARARHSMICCTSSLLAMTTTPIPLAVFLPM